MEVRGDPSFQITAGSAKPCSSGLAKMPPKSLVHSSLWQCGTWPSSLVWISNFHFHSRDRTHKEIRDVLLNWLCIMHTRRFCACWVQVFQSFSPIRYKRLEQPAQEKELVPFLPFFPTHDINSSWTEGSYSVPEYWSIFVISGKHNIIDVIMVNRCWSH